MPLSPQVIFVDSLDQAKEELLRLNVNKTGVEIMAPKVIHRVVKLKGITSAAANIIKQEMLSRGGEAAVNYGTINALANETDMLLMGTKLQFDQLIRKLDVQPFGLPELAHRLEASLRNFESTPPSIYFGNKVLDFSERTFVMGILNVTNDSFSDGGLYLDPDNAFAWAKKMVEDGADIIDIGGESTRPKAKETPLDVELKRVVPVIEKIAKELNVIISVDTHKSEVASAALAAGAHLINDVSGLHYDPKMAGVIAQNDCPCILMHMRGTALTMQDETHYADLISDIVLSLEESINIAAEHKITRDKIIIDPGIGFAKTTLQNLKLLKHLKTFKVLGCAIIIGPSRKSMIGDVLNLPVHERLEGTAAAVASAVLNGAHIVRVHDVKQIKRVVKMIDAVKSAQ
jgi:dihydropteroate synthase